MCLVSFSPHAVPLPYSVGPYQLATDGRYTVTGIDSVVAAGWASLVWRTARIEKRPMWFVLQVTVKAPPGWTVARAVGAHSHAVWRPSRSISIVLPASPGAVPVKVSRWRSIAEVRVCTVMPLPVALTRLL